MSGDFADTLEAMTVTTVDARPYRFYLARAVLAARRRNSQSSTAYYDSAAAALELWVGEDPDNALLHSLLGIAYAGLARDDEAIAEARQGVVLRPESDPFSSTPLLYLARTLLMVGRYDEAIEELERLVTMPSRVSVAWLRIHPMWEPLRNHPRFVALLARSSDPTAQN